MRTSLLGIATIGLALLGCTDRGTITESSTASLAMRTAAKPVSYPVVSLSVEVADGTTKIQSDGKGLYTDGSQNVMAVFDQYGSFLFRPNTASARKAAVRWVTFNFDSPVDPNNTTRPVSNNQVANFATQPSSFTPFTAPQSLAINASTCLALGIGFSGTQADWRASFHYGLEDVSTSPSAYALVTRTSSTSWTVIPGTCSLTTSSVAALRSGDGAILYGYYSLPFQFTLRVK